MHEAKARLVAAMRKVLADRAQPFNETDFTRLADAVAQEQARMVVVVQVSLPAEKFLVLDRLHGQGAARVRGAFASFPLATASAEHDLLAAGEGQLEIVLVQQRLTGTG